MAFASSVGCKSYNSENAFDNEILSRNESEYEDDLQEVYEMLYK